MALGTARKDEASASVDSASAKQPRLTEAGKQRCIEENREAFAAYDAMVEKYGIFGEEYRQY